MEWSRPQIPGGATPAVRPSRSRESHPPGSTSITPIVCHPGRLAMPKLPRSPHAKESLALDGSAATAAATTIPPSPSAASHRSQASAARGSSSRRLSTEAEEAELLSQATAQAMIAARSILMAGGSDATALSTARAAATSILAPTTTTRSDYEQKSFLGRRKGKRQAEIVASMALLSVKQTMPQDHATPTAAGGGNATTHSQRSVPPSSPVSPRRTPLQPPAAERHDWLGRKRTNASPAAPPPPPSSHPSQSTSSSSSNTRTTTSTPSTTRTLTILPPTTFTTHPTTTVAPDLHRLPQHLPKPRPKTKDLADSLPHEDPIYYTDLSTIPRRRARSSSVSGGSLSSSSTSSSSSSHGSMTDSSLTCDTYGDETVEASAIAQAIADRHNRLAKQRGGADAFLSNLSDLILCGMVTGTNEDEDDHHLVPAQDRDATVQARRANSSVQSRESMNSSDSEDDDGNDSTSSVSSTELLEALNKASFEHTTTAALKRHSPLVHASAMTDSIRKTMEQALVLVSSKERSVVSDASPTPVVEQRQEESPPPQSVITLQFQPGNDDIHDSPTGKPNRLQILRQRVKFRSWMNRRRGGMDGAARSQLPTYE